MKQTIKIAIADDHLVFRDALKNVINKFPNFKVVATYSNGRQLLDSIPLTQPNVIIMDVCMPVMNGIEATALLKERHSEIGVLAISVFDIKEHVHDMLKAGAKGFISKGFFEYLDLHNAILDIYEKGFHYNKIVTKELVEKLGITPTEETTNHIGRKLSTQERKVLLFICEGLSTKQIAGKMQISTSTVDKLRVNIYINTNTKVIATLVMYAVKKGWV